MQEGSSSCAVVMVLAFAAAQWFTVVLKALLVQLQVKLQVQLQVQPQLKPLAALVLVTADSPLQILPYAYAHSFQLS